MFEELDLRIDGEKLHIKGVVTFAASCLQSSASGNKFCYGNTCVTEALSYGGVACTTG
jgi:hypothetical protein